MPIQKGEVGGLLVGSHELFWVGSVYPSSVICKDEEERVGHAVLIPFCYEQQGVTIIDIRTVVLQPRLY